jgi:ADP-dependent NAD(P)H-hydrate dehydratase / NAD(P)H-hydrate epimerase
LKLVTVAEMQSIEREADANGLSYAQMMENAGAGLAEVIMAAFISSEVHSALGLVGSGNNGGDTLVALERLAENGWQTTAYLARPRRKGDPLVARVIKAGGEVVPVGDDPGYAKLAELIASHDVFLDGLLGSGIRLPLKPEAEKVLEAASSALEELEFPPLVAAVDCPSGVDMNSGEAAAVCIPADLTVTMAAVKVGLLRFPAHNFVGELHQVEIGSIDSLPAWQSVRRMVADEAWVQSVLPERPLDAHKGTFGTALVVAGSVNYTGAALLAGEAAYRSGAGLVTLGVPGQLHGALAGQFPEATWVILPSDMGVISREAATVVEDNLERVTALLIGPGFGTEDTTRDFLSTLLGASSARRRKGSMGFSTTRKEIDSGGNEDTIKLPPMVIDADGLKLLSQLDRWQKQLPEETILTPHPGEMSVLTGLDKEEIQSGRLEAAERFAAEWGCVVVLKGAFTVVAAPDGRTAVIPVATPALARAGTGDVLAGLIVGLRAQGLDAFQAATAGAWIHGEAGMAAAEAMGNTASVLAGDVLSAITEVMTALMVPSGF